LEKRGENAPNNSNVITTVHDGKGSPQAGAVYVSVVQVSGDGYGQVTLTRSYDPFGNVLSSVGNEASAFGYAEQWEDGSGLIDLRARYYLPADGRFLTEDSWQGDNKDPMSLNHWD